MQEHSTTEVLPLIVTNKTSQALWACRRCTLLNDDQCDRCQVCEAPIKDKVPRELDSNATLLKQELLEISPPETSIHTINRELEAAGKESCKILERNPKEIIRIDDCKINSTNDKEWICNYCTFNNNPSWAVICDMCHSVRQVYGDQQLKYWKQNKKTPSKHLEKQLTWICKTCTTENQNFVRDCAACGCLRTPTKLTICQPLNEIWTCSKCTLQNLLSAHACGACGSKQDLGLKYNEWWTCRTCTLVNKSNMLQCDACGILNGPGNVSPPITSFEPQISRFCRKKFNLH